MNIQAVHTKLIIQGDMTIQELSSKAGQVLSYVQSFQESELTIDVSGVTSIDSSGVALIDRILAVAGDKGIEASVYGETAHVAQARKLFSPAGERKSSVDERDGLLARIGDGMHHVGQHVQDAFILCADAFYYSVTGLFHKKGMRKGEFYNQCMLLGMNSMPIVTIIGFLIGFIIALQSAAQLRQFGAGIYIADLIAISMTREMGPIMTAIVFAGRSGSSIAAEIATMVVTEETDALKTMGLSPVKYVLVPKIYAITASVPLLTVYSMVIGIIGAMLVGITYLGVGIEPFYNQVINALIIRDVITGVVKSFVFAWIIVLVAAYYGFRVKGGAEVVGRATTASVVVSIFLVIVADSILGLIFYFGQGLNI